MSSSCQSLLAALRDCLLASECVTKQGHKPTECLRDHTDELPEECRMLRKATFDCKRGMICGTDFAETLARNFAMCRWTGQLLLLWIQTRVECKSSRLSLLIGVVTNPMGYKVTVFLAELQLAYPSTNLSYAYESINISTNRQKEPWFLELNPNGRIPVLIDRQRNNFVVFETAAILLYLAQHYDVEKKFWFDVTNEADDYSEMLQWVFFAHGGIGPMQGQAHHFHHAAPTDIPYGKKRYTEETKRLYGVLELRLAQNGGRDWLAGPGRGKISIADINVSPWVRVYKKAFVDIEEFPRVKAWLQRLLDRPGYQAGLNVPVLP
ncbi:hypothetical protein MIND_00698300 [Mycena indigotica]|uniref:Glutathione S-transferase n=1 Tax=Mycena indigotica TaxID=2126181 RepID=A0A8H6SN69_9AGAR|nr:uncharacterized protein MIND_00698300 [Mycena indigotica]KAF7301332.1 hypothetical protein MIND_00698300 [Mycena indigotica]